jgi:soluble lytic murein transglycosylase-like protein
MRHILLLFVVVTLTACQTAAPPQPHPTPEATLAALPAPATAAPATLTSQPPKAVAPATTPTPKPVPTNLPTLPISNLDKVPEPQRGTIRQAQAALAAGDDNLAVRLLAPLELNGEAQLEVQLLLAQAYVGAHTFDKALAVADSVLNSARRPDLVSAARLAKGQALRGLDRWDEAAAEMRAVADSNPLVAAAVRLELAEMWLHANRPDEAAADGQTGLESAEARLLKIALGENVGKAEVELGHTDAAMDAYRQLLTAAGSKGYLGEQLYNLAEGASALGRTEDAIPALRTSVEQFPRSRKAPDAVELLEKLGGMRAQDRFYAGVIRYLFWNFRGARADFDAYLTALPDGDHAIEATYYRALSSLPQDTTRQLLAVADQHPDDDFAPMALLEAGKAQEELEDYASAERIYDRLIATYPTRDAGLAGAFRRGLARYMRGDAPGALTAWDELMSRDLQGSVRSEALYWSGKVLAQQGDSAGARANYAAAAAVRPVDYHVMRAQVELSPPPASSDFDPSKPQVSDEAQLAEWFSQHNLDLAAAARTASQDPAYIRAVALVQHGLYRQANWEHEIFLTTYADKPDRLYWLAARFGELGLPSAELKLGSAALGAATADGQVSMLDVPNALQRVASPLVFPNLVAPMAKARGLDPLLFTSLMHQESDFDPYAESVAKAKGLTQIIPKTGNEIAAALKVSDFRQEELFQPKRSVEFGAWYFSQRLKRNGSISRALAAYNAGDGNVDNWTGRGREDPDVFVEYVPFAETHDYVKRIHLYWWINRYVWAGQQH